MCVMHNPNVPSDSQFTSFSSVRCEPTEKLLHLHEIRDRRLAEPIESPFRMKDVCDMLPASLDDLDLERTGYHRRCYQGFTMHLDRLKNKSSDSSGAPSTSQRHHSPRKQKSADDKVKFPPGECLFCEKNEIKVDGKTQRPTRSFAAWKKETSEWKKNEPMPQMIPNF